jgi:hypothetical protein
MISYKDLKFRKAHTSAKVHCRVELVGIVEFVEFVGGVVAELESAAQKNRKQ